MSLASEQGQKRRRRDDRVRNSGQVDKRSWGVPLEPQPNMPAPYDKADVAAIRAVAEGRAEPYQQRLAFDWLMYICGTYENPYRTGSDGARDTDFAAGKQWVGQQLAKVANLKAVNAEQGEQG